MTPLLAQGLRADRSFERMYKRHAGDVYRYALAVLRNPADAEDVTQTTFLNAYRAYAGGERPRQPQNWLITIAHNTCRQRFRQSQRRPQEVAFDDSVGEWLDEDDRGPNAEDLRRALSHLAFNQRAALVMRELEGRSYGEIAEILGLTVAAVETLIFRARRALREQLEGTLTCAEAERALSLEADGELPRAEKGPLRAHLRECKECAAAARRQRAQRSAWKALGALPVPASLSSLFGGGGAALGVKAAAVAASAIAAGGIGLAGERHFTAHPAKAKRHPVAHPTALKVAAVPAAAVPLATRAPVAVVRQAIPTAVNHGKKSGADHGRGHGSPALQPQRVQVGGRAESQGRGKASGHEKQQQRAGHGNGAAKSRHQATTPLDPQPVPAQAASHGDQGSHGQPNGGRGHGQGKAKTNVNVNAKAKAMGRTDLPGAAGVSQVSLPDVSSDPLQSPGD
jgi:RNA polymerase sigma factor (sigma-70 family)